jgi:alpha-amylase/alpha-mannosidase (GH57 family)
MHQPYYVDPVSRMALMPWVRLHSVKGYLDMISVLEDFPRVRANFNLTPVLMLQLRELLEGTVGDLWLEWSRKPAAELEEHERLALLENFFKIHWEHLVKPHPRYWELLNKRGLTFYREEVRRGLRYFSRQEFLDLQVWFNLAWCGYTAERLFPELKELKRKGRGFTEEEKNRVLDLHFECMGLIAGKYRAAEERGQAELTTTPFFHPILPLVYDSALAERSLPGRKFPKRFHWPQDAAAQLTLAVDQHAAMFGRTPRGLWPSEGSIAPELIPLMQESGLEYFCSDEENLFHSLRREPTAAGRAVDHLELFQGWKVLHDGASMNALFRERPLSDFIGFTAAKNGPAEAAGHLLHHLGQIAGVVPRETGVIPLILDGENAWETFADGGESFLRALYGGIEAQPELLHSCTIEDYFRHHPPSRRITSLHTGSWIGSNFDIWIGEEEENRAWNLLGEARAFLQEKIEAGLLTPDQHYGALREIYAAEGSDWFWWYGPDFSTENDALFDNLFRQHLKNVYLKCDAIPPATLDRPITSGQPASLYAPPTRLLAPVIDGRPESFFEWHGAGVYLTGTEQGAMHRSERLIQRILFGCGEKDLFLRFDLHRWEPLKLRVEFAAPAGAVVETEEIQRGEPAGFSVSLPGAEPVPRTTLGAFASIEMSVPLADLGAPSAEALSFRVKVFRAGLEVERYPETSRLQCARPGEEFMLEHWIV